MTGEATEWIGSILHLAHCSSPGINKLFCSRKAMHSHYYTRSLRHTLNNFLDGVVLVSVFLSEELLSVDRKLLR
jgi:hypothetical protein